MPLFDLFWAMMWFFLWVAWIWVLVSVVFDIFRSHDLSGWAKGLWVLFVIVVPWLGVLTYLIVRGGDMAQRSVDQAAAQDTAARAYIQDAAGGSSAADEIQKLADLRSSGVISDSEFEAQKAKLLV